MALTAGDVTIKLSGGDYPSWVLFWDDIGNLTGDLTCTVDASAFTESTAPADVTESLNGYTLHVKPASYPTETDASDGARFTCNYTNEILMIQMEGSGSLIIEGMVFIEGSSVPVYCFYTYSIGTDFTFIFRRNIVKGGETAIWHRDLTLATIQVYNNIFFDQSYQSWNIDYGSLGDVIWAFNTLVDCTLDNADFKDKTLDVENNLSYGAGDKDFQNIEGSTSGYNNASSDATCTDAYWGDTGSNNVPSISDPFNGYGTDDFTITMEGDVGRAGKPVSGITTDFFGETRHVTTPTIGACEWVSGGADIQRTVNDSIGVTDAMSRVATVVRTIAESMGVTDADSKVHEAVRTVAESMGITDTTAMDLAIVLAESMGITDAEARVCVTIRVLAESMGIADTASRICEVYRTIAESMGVTDSMSRVAVVERVVAETLGVTDSITGVRGVLRTFDESMGIVDTVAKDESLVLSDSLGITDAVTRICVVIRTIAESLGLTDDVSRVWEAVRTVADSMGITDVVVPLKSLEQTISDSLGLTDTASRVHVALRVLSEQLGLTDSIARVFTISRLISDSMGITDGQALDRVITVTDSLGITDDFVRLLDYVRTQDDDIGLLDSLVKVSGIMRTIDDDVGITDMRDVQHVVGGVVKAVWAFMIMRQTHN